MTKKGTTSAGRIHRGRSFQVLWSEVNSVTVRNRQSTRRVKVPLLKRIAGTLVRELLHKQQFELAVFLVDEAEITQLNETFMEHKGTTDVITLDYCEAGTDGIAGDIFICIDEACIQAKRFRTTWQSEVIRYVVHGVLHLSGYDDRVAKDAHRMKEAEDRLVTQLERRFAFKALQMQTRRSKPERRPKAEDRTPK